MPRQRTYGGGTATSAPERDDEFNVYAILGPPLEMRVNVRHISVYETGLSFVVTLDLMLPENVRSALDKSLLAFGEQYAVEICPRTRRVESLSAGSANDEELSLSFDFDDEAEAIPVLNAFYDHLNVLLRLETASATSPLTAAGAAQFLSRALGGSVSSSQIAPNVYEHKFTAEK